MRVEMTAARFCDELPFGFGWIAPEPRLLERASHALVEDGRRVWLVDPVDVPGLDDRVRALGEPEGVVRLMDRHGRDGDRLAARYGVAVHHAPRGAVPGSPFEVVRTVDLPGWREAALWWPERRTLVVGDALGTAAYFLGPGERIAVHPLLRLLPPRRLGRLSPEHVLCGHGEGIHGDGVEAALHEALRTSRRGIPRWLVGLARGLRERPHV
jgi:hypothetical protein